MYHKLWQTMANTVNVDRIRRDTREIFQLAQWVSFDKINELAALIARMMSDAGMTDVQIIKSPADGRTFYNGWVMPEAYDVRSGHVELAEPEADDPVLFDYASNPFGLMMHSGGTGGKELTAQVVEVNKDSDLSTLDLVAKVVLVHGTNPQMSTRLFENGAVGIIDDTMGRRPYIKDGPYLDDAVQWNNYSLPPWMIPVRGFGITITPRNGRRLRDMLAKNKHVTVHACLDIQRYDGVLPTITGVVPGKSTEELILTGHYDEPGADDNASGVAIAIETARAIAELQSNGSLPGLQRSIRFVFGMEVRGLQALINTTNIHENAILGLNIDTVGSDQNGVTSFCTAGENFSVLPSFTYDLLCELLRKVASVNPLFRWKQSAWDIIDNIFGEPSIGAPVPQLYHFTAHHHSNLDRPEELSSNTLHEMATVTGTYFLFLANAGLPEACWLSRLAAQDGREAIQEVCRKDICTDNGHCPGAAATRTALEKTTDKHTTRIDSTATLVEHATGDHASLRKLCERLKTELVEYVEIEQRRIIGTSQPTDEPGLRDGPDRKIPDLMPRKAFLGFLGFEDLSADEKTELEAIGVRIGWGAPRWLQQALFASTGSRTLSQIHTRFCPETDLEMLYQVFVFLEKRGMVQLTKP